MRLQEIIKKMKMDIAPDAIIKNGEKVYELQDKCENKFTVMTGSKTMKTQFDHCISSFDEWN